MTGGYTTAGHAGSPGFYSTPYSYSGYNYWNPVYYAGYPAGYPYGYQGFYGSYGYSPGYGSSVASVAQSDEEIRDDVRNRLDQNDQLKGANIDVDIDNGIVTFSGEVKNQQEKELAETEAFTVVAVRGIHNQLAVAQQPAGKEQPKRRASSTRQRSKAQKEE